MPPPSETSSGSQQTFSAGIRDDVGLSRRALLKSALVAGAISPLLEATGASRAVAAADQPSPEIWDSHIHLSSFTGNTPEAKTDSLLEFADRMGISRLIAFMGWPWSTNPTPESIRSQNDQVLQALQHSPRRLLGYAYLNPADGLGSLNEIRRCIADGPMVGIKLWVAERCNQEMLHPILELATELKAVVYQHTWIKSTGNLPGESTPDDLVALARRHPDCSIICGHSGGNWELGLRAMRSAPANVSFEIAGNDPTAGITERAVQELGADRLVYGSDAGGRSLATQLAKILGADISEQDKASILGQNIRKLLEPIMRKKGMSS